MMTLIEPAWLWALWSVPAALALLVYASWRQRVLLRRFLGSWLVGDGGTGDRAGALPSRVKQAVRGALFLAALASLVVALARPGINPKPQKVKRSGRDVVILLDVSRSMLARDLKPSRLERAKILIRDMLDAARGDRVGIIAFAGSTVVRCPLTTDYSFARLSLDNLAPDAVSRGGTFIGDAIRTALDQVFTEGDDRFRDIVLITDGDDQESKPVDAARLAGARGIRVIAIGLGSELEGAMVPTDIPGSNGKPEYVTYEGSVVRSKLDSGSLRAIAEASKDGVFLNVGTGNIQMDKVYRTLAERAERREVDSAERVKYDELFQYALGVSAALIALHALVGQRRQHGIQ